MKNLLFLFIVSLASQAYASSTPSFTMDLRALNTCSEATKGRGASNGKSRFQSCAEAIIGLNFENNDPAQCADANATEVGNCLRSLGRPLLQNEPTSGPAIFINVRAWNACSEATNGHGASKGKSRFQSCIETVINVDFGAKDPYVCAKSDASEVPQCLMELISSKQ